MKRTLALLLLGLLVAACGGSGAQTTEPTPNAPQPAAGKSSPTHHTPAPKSPSPKGTATPHASAAAGPAGSGTSGSSGSGAAAPAQPRQPGTYWYDTHGQSTFGGGFTQQMPSETTLDVDAARGAQQRSVRDLTDDQGNGSITETWLEFRGDGVYLDRVRTTTTYGPVTNSSEFAPSSPALVSKPGEGIGAHTEFTMTSEGSKAHVAIDVIRQERVSIGGTAVDTFLVRTVTTFSGDLQGESTSDTWYTPDRLLPVKEHVVIDAQSNQGSFHSEYRAQLRSLSPS